MSPSRGLGLLLRPRAPKGFPNIRRYSGFIRAATDPNNKTQIYISRSNNPYLNLSIEDYLLHHTPDNSTILFLYENRRSVIIGRNQNPWTEVNLALLGDKSATDRCDLVRRRTGGGTVVHDQGNVNYCVICPSEVFDRDRHAEMVVRALRSLGSKTSRVNVRHDVEVDDIDPTTQEKKTFKVSGSAYKLTRKRSLHHGTCLLNTENLKRISQILRSPARPFVQARGVESVRSPITNVQIPSTAFERAVTFEFNLMYGDSEPIYVGEAEAGIPFIATGVESLQTEDWIWGQTPQFTFSSNLTPDMIQISKELGTDLLIPSIAFPGAFEASFTARHGAITEISIRSHQQAHNKDFSCATQTAMDSLKGRGLHTIKDWEDQFYQHFPSSPNPSQLPKWIGQLRAAGLGLNYLFNGANSRLLSDFGSYFTRETLTEVMQMGSGSPRWRRAQEEMRLQEAKRK